MIMWIHPSRSSLLIPRFLSKDFEHDIEVQPKTSSSAQLELFNISLYHFLLRMRSLAHLPSFFLTFFRPPYIPLSLFGQDAQPLHLLTCDFNVVATHSNQKVIKGYVTELFLSFFIIWIILFGQIALMKTFSFALPVRTLIMGH